MKAAVIVLMLPAAACVTGTGPANAHFALERNYIGVVPSDTTLMYEGQAAAHVFVMDNLDGAFSAIATDSARSSGALRVIVTPMFRVRQSLDSTSAVRAPSFMPRISAEYLWAVRIDEVSEAPPNLLFSPVLVAGARLSLAHHSNGQSSCFREGFDPVDRRATECRARPGFDTSIVRVNLVNGHFTNTSAQLMAHATLMNRGIGGYPTHTGTVAVAFDQHLTGVFGALPDEQRALYGSWRVRGLGEATQAFGTSCEKTPEGASTRSVLCVFRGRARLTAEYERGPQDPGALALRVSPRILPWRSQLEASFSFGALLGAGVFARWHDGQDYYNINFVNRRRVFMYGVMLDASALPRVGPHVIR